MTIVVDNNYHAKETLEELGIYCIDHKTAQKQDIRPLRIGILNIMPEVDSYEVSVLYPLGRTLIQIYPVWIKLNSQTYKSSKKNYISNEYVTFDEAVADKHLDGLIVTGAPVESLDFEEVRYWNEISNILSYARKNIASTLGICWGGLALANMLGIKKTLYREKLFGVFDNKNIDRTNRITGNLDDRFFCPQSRHAGIDDEELEQKQKDGVVNLLAHSEDAGYSIFESSDGKFLVHLGHPEYESDRLVEEYLRDMDKGVKGVVRPTNVNINKPINQWRGHRHEFYGQWIKYVYETTPF